MHACKVVGGVEEMELHSCLHPLYHFIPLSIVVMSSCIFYFSFVLSIVWLYTCMLIVGISLVSLQIH